MMSHHLDFSVTTFPVRDAATRAPLPGNRIPSRETDDRPGRRYRIEQRVFRRAGGSPGAADALPVLAR